MARRGVQPVFGVLPPVLVDQDCAPQERLWPGSWTEAGKATAASPAGASNARELALFRVTGITPVRHGTYIL